MPEISSHPFFYDFLVFFLLHSLCKKNYTIISPLLEKQPKKMIVSCGEVFFLPKFNKSPI